MNKKIQNQIISKKNKAVFSLLFLLCCNISFANSSVTAPNSMQVGQVINQKRVTLSITNKPLRYIMTEIEKLSGVGFMIKDDDQAGALNNLSISVKDVTVKEALDTLLANTNYGYQIVDNIITIFKKPVVKAAVQAKRTLEGVVSDALAKAPIAGATVLVQGTAVGAITDMEGKFSLQVSDNETLEVSFLGMKQELIIITPSIKKLDVKMRVDEMAVKDVVITGIYTRKADSFTGSYSSFNAKDLKAIGGNNVLQSLKTLDPSFNMIENNAFGSDPNRLPDIEIRGKSSMLGMRDEFAVDPNQPLFILDGFETTLSTIVNLDMNRIESITLLKDAASTAIYGSKAANGVVVVETVRPTSGKLRVSYNGKIDLSIPDLSSYNLMNAREKLDFESLAGVYNYTYAENQVIADRKYNARYSEIARGVDTYWLADPLRIGTNHRNSIYIEGGSGDFSFLVGGNYNGVTGVMKGSNKDVLGGNIDINYRFNKFRFTNKFMVDYSKSKNPLVGFSEYANANSYYDKFDVDGNPKKWLEVIDNGAAEKTFVANPKYNASLNSRNESKTIVFSNNFNAEYMPVEDFRIRARFGLTKTISETDVFTSPDHTMYAKKQILDRGDYNYINGNQFSYEGELTATYAKLFNDVHSINLVAGGTIGNNDIVNQGYAAHGFPSGDFTYPSFAGGYREGASPTYFNSVNRSVSAYLNGGYSYDNRYLMDVSYRVNGSSVFGSSKRFANTWAVGLAWNLHNEKFIKAMADGITSLKLRASVGNPGNQNFDSFMTFTTYRYNYNTFNYFGMSSYMNALGNGDLKWQKTLDKNIGIDITILRKRLTITADYYHKKTDPLLININTPTSTGVPFYTTNMGNQTSKGLSATVLGYIIYRPQDQFTLNVRGNVRYETSQIGGIGNNLEALNKLGQTNSSLVRYYDGANPDALWAVKSLGIDPGTGREAFQTKAGVRTYDYSNLDEQIMGNSRPKVEGIFGAAIRYKGFSADVNFRYRLGGDIFNTALYNKVENVKDLTKNQDKRAYYDRWKKPGDISKFKDIKISSTTPISSRFIQRENTLALESVRIGYEFPYAKVDKWGIGGLKIDAYMNDVFRASTVLSERGISYPFARAFQLAVSINF